MKTIYLHIGMPKTGTSAIQVFLAQNTKALEENNYTYPELENLESARLGKITSGNFGYISRCLLPTFHEDHPQGSDATTELRNAVKALTRCHYKNIILSSEFLTVLSNDSLLFLRNSLSEFNVKIIVYLRAQECFIQSVYAQRIKNHQETESADTFIKKRLNDNSILNYYHLANKFSAIFGKKNLIIRRYEKEQLLENNLLIDFLEAISIKEKRLFKVNEQWINTSVGKNIIRLQRLSNKFIPYFYRPRFIRWINNIFTPTALYNKKNIIDDILIQKIRINFKESNQKLVLEYLEKKNTTLFKHRD